ncbi:MAG: hypothetical protein VXW22_10305, partial [Pseudomonadota bacterium]|nr:hypothetical protein [Pseudomonadota bacterium]
VDAYSENRITKIPPQKHLGPVYVAFDIGGNTDHTALTFGQYDGHEYFINHGYKAKTTDLDHFIQYIIDFCRKWSVRLGAALPRWFASTRRPTSGATSRS